MNRVLNVLVLNIFKQCLTYWYDILTEALTEGNMSIALHGDQFCFRVKHEVVSTSYVKLVTT